MSEIEKFKQLYNDPPISYPNDDPKIEKQLKIDNILTFCSLDEISKHIDMNKVFGADTKIPAITLNNKINNGCVLRNPKPNWDKEYPIIPMMISHFLPILSDNEPKINAPIT